MREEDITLAHVLTPQERPDCRRSVCITCMLKTMHHSTPSQSPSVGAANILESEWRACGMASLLTIGLPSCGVNNW